MAETWLSIVRDGLQVPGLLKEVYGDLARPGVIQVGKALDTTLGLGNTLLLPLTLANAKARVILKKNLEKYRAQLEGEPDQIIVAVAPEIGVPILEKLAYVSDDVLGDLYVNLLAKASLFNTAGCAHPSFVNVINNLSPDEGLLLLTILKMRAVPYVTAKVIKRKANEWTFERDHLTGLERTVQLAFPENIVAYLSNCEGLGLIRSRKGEYIMDLPLYEALEKYYHAKFSSVEFDKESSELKFDRSMIDITPFGQLFSKACVGSVDSAGEVSNS